VSIRPLPNPASGAFPSAIEAWALTRSGDAAVARAVGLLAAAEMEGHAAIDWPDPPPHRWIGDGRTPTPLVAADGRLSYWRNWQHEQRIAEAVAQRVSADPTRSKARVAAIEADLAALRGRYDASDAQQQAIRAAIGRHLSVITGGPGTGKTTTVLDLLLVLIRDRLRETGRPPSIRLAAPTGKAAQRMAESLRFGLGHEPRRGLLKHTADWHPVRAALPDSAGTLHRLLGADPGADRFRHGPGRPLAADVVVVDEASMVDLNLMRALFDALAPKCSLILLGDPDQLVSVSAGSVLADLVRASQSLARPGRYFHRLQRGYRADDALGPVNDAIRAGDADALQQAITASRGRVALRPATDVGVLKRMLADWYAQLHSTAYREAIDTGDAPAAFAELARAQLLCALREGSWGVHAINAWLDERHGGVSQPGRPVIVRSNDPLKRLWNGDIGLTMLRGGQLRIVFPPLPGESVWRDYAPAELSTTEAAWALTIHQSQGSEYGRVALLLPPDAEHRILSRQLIYTGATRARQQLEFWADAAVLAGAISRITQRRGGLADQLAARLRRQP
jgi:exodeoxyribonuclease V alpha subunit